MYENPEERNLEIVARLRVHVYEYIFVISLYIEVLLQI